jgi:hypothetical protein
MLMLEDVVGDGWFFAIILGHLVLAAFGGPPGYEQPSLNAGDDASLAQPVA